MLYHGELSLCNYIIFLICVRKWMKVELVATCQSIGIFGNAQLVKPLPIQDLCHRYQICIFNYLNYSYDYLISRFKVAILIIHFFLISLRKRIKVLYTYSIWYPKHIWIHVFVSISSQFTPLTRTSMQNNSKITVTSNFQP